MLKNLAMTLVLVAAAAPAQVTSYQWANTRPIDGEPNKIVCQKEEKIGTRLGGKKVCLTVAEWKERADVARGHAERLQSHGCVQSSEGCPVVKEGF